MNNYPGFKSWFQIANRPHLVEIFLSEDLVSDKELVVFVVKGLGGQVPDAVDRRLPAKKCFHEISNLLEPNHCSSDCLDDEI